jgi:hypothetical protein
VENVLGVGPVRSHPQEAGVRDPRGLERRSQIGSRLRDGELGN